MVLWPAMKSKRWPSMPMVLDSPSNPMVMVRERPSRSMLVVLGAINGIG